MNKRSYALVALVLVALVAASCGRDEDATPTGTAAVATTAGGGSATTAASGAAAQAPTSADPCATETPQATEIGVTADTITVETLADVGSSLAPGLFQGNHDALAAFAEYVNAQGGIACRQLEVKLWDTKLNADESKNGLIDSCTSALAMVGGNALFNPDITPIVECKDQAGAATGLPDIAALAADFNEQCGPTLFTIQGVQEACVVREGSRDFTVQLGTTKYYEQVAGEPLHGMFMVPGDLPTTVQSSVSNILGQQQAGVTWDAVLKVSGRDEQAAYTPRVQQLKAAAGNYVYNGSNDRAMAAMMKEARAQGVDTVKVWACSLSCYTRNMLAAGGADVEGVYLWMQFLPFEEKDSNEALAAYVDAVGADKVDSFGAQAWQAAMLFKEVIDEIVETDGINGITRARMLEVLNTKDDFTADGWMGTEGKPLKGFSNCIVIMQIEGGKFVRRFPEQPGTLDCTAGNIATVTADPAAEAAKIQ